MQGWMLHFWEETGLVAVEHILLATTFPVESLHCTTRVLVPPAGAGKATLSWAQSLSWKWKQLKMEPAGPPAGRRQLTSAIRTAGTPGQRLPRKCHLQASCTPSCDACRRFV